MQEACARRPGPPVYVACPRIGCQGTNSARFNFCQWCGVPRRLVAMAADSVEVREDLISARVTSLRADIESKPHSKSKCAEFLQFQKFLESRMLAPKRKRTVFEASPEDVIDFLAHRDVSGAGKTIVHTHSCMSREATGCECPRRMAAGTMRGIASRIRTRFYELGTAGPWDCLSAAGNPAESNAVSGFLKAVDEEQARAGCGVLTARDRALLPGKFQSFVKRLRLFASEKYDAGQKAQYIRVLFDIAWFCIQYRSLNRGDEIGSLRAAQTAFGPNDCCILFQFTWSKTARCKSDAFEFAVQSRPEDATCPVIALRRYLKMATRLLGWSWSSNGAFIFPQTTKNQPTSMGMSASAMQQRFTAYLRLFGMFEGEGLHGLRAGGALSMALQGASLKEIMLQGFWKKPETARHYIGMLEGLTGESMSSAIATKVGAEFLITAEEASLKAQPIDFLVRTAGR